MKSICIIGAGLSGGYLANELLNFKNFEINLVDIDSIKNNFNKDIKLQNVYSNNHTNIKFIDPILKGYGFGGTSNYWHGGLTEFDEFELNKIDNFLKTDFSTSLKKYYKKVWESLGVERFKTKNFRFFEIYKIFKESLNFKIKEIFLQRNPLNTRSLLLRIKKNKNINLFENSICLYLNASKANKIKSITIYNEGSQKEITSDIFIISAGSFETPRILLQSIDSGNLVLNNENIGSHLIDHPFLKIGEIENNKKIKNNIEYFNKTISKKFIFRNSFSFIEKKFNYHLNHSIVLRPHINEDLMILKFSVKKNLNNKNLVQLFFIIFKNIYRLDLFYYLITSYIKKNNNSSKKIDVYFYLDQVSSKKNKVILTNKKDEFMRSIPKITYGYDQDEKSSLKNIYSLIKLLFNRTNYIFKINDYPFLNFYHGNHFSGTARMSYDEKTGVVDKNLKVHGLSNLYICDSSVIPFFGNSNPVLTLMALSKRLANNLSK